MIYGYCRKSRPSQNIDRQVRNIQEKFPDALIIKEVFTGTKMNRPEWDKVYKRVKAGDVIVFDSVSRMSRDACEGFLVYEDLFKRGVDLIFLKERHIDTATYKKAIEGQLKIAVNTGDGKTDDLINGISEAINRYLMSLAKEQIRLAFEQAEKEVADLHQRTREGIETARLNGKQIGQVPGAKLYVKKKKPMKEQIKRKSKAFGGSYTDADLIKILGIARNTYYKYKREIRVENMNTQE